MYALNTYNGNVQFVDARNVGSKTTLLGGYYKDEATMDANVPASVAAKDKPYLTYNDKVFASRHNASELAGWVPGGTTTGIQ